MESTLIILGFIMFIVVAIIEANISMNMNIENVIIIIIVIIVAFFGYKKINRDGVNGHKLF